LDNDGWVDQVAEKSPISSNATVGIYYYARGSDYVDCAEQMIKKDIRTNNEFYVCPVYNELIERGGKVRIKNIERMWGVGTPEDLQNFLQNYQGAY
jgi:dTDP-glucose pyrophosphorylase